MMGRYKLVKIAFSITSLLIVLLLAGCGGISQKNNGIDEYMKIGDYQIRVVRAYPWVQYQIDPNTQEILNAKSILVVEVEILVPQEDDFTIIQGWRPSVWDKNGDSSPEIQAAPQVKYSTETLGKEWIEGSVEWIFSIDASLSPFTLILPGGQVIPLDSFFEVDTE